VAAVTAVVAVTAVEAVTAVAADTAITKQTANKLAKGRSFRSDLSCYAAKLSLQ
jgi:hypothetical protein